MIETVISNSNTHPTKHWWSLELMAKHTEVCRLTCRAYSRRSEPDDPVHQRHKEARRVYGLMLECTKKLHWEGFLTLVNKRSV